MFIPMYAGAGLLALTRCRTTLLRKSGDRSQVSTSLLLLSWAIVTLLGMASMGDLQDQLVANRDGPERVQSWFDASAICPSAASVGAP